MLKLKAHLQTGKNGSKLVRFKEQNIFFLYKKPSLERFSPMSKYRFTKAFITLVRLFVNLNTLTYTIKHFMIVNSIAVL